MHPGPDELDPRVDSVESAVVPLDETTIEQLQVEQTNVLLGVRDFCEAHDLAYFLFGGTLLGAVRHESNIPWDDDVDIAMPREDFERFVERAANDPSFPLKLWWHTVDPDYPWAFAKVVGPTHDEFTNVHPKVPPRFNGPRIDVFPLDRADSGTPGLAIRGLGIRILKRLLSPNPDASVLERRVVVPLRRLGVLNRRRLQRAIAWLGSLGNGRALDGIVCFVSPYPFMREFHSASAYEPTHLTYRGHTFRAPSGHHEILTRVFGDYMTPPPVETRMNRPHYMRFVRSHQSVGDTPNGRGPVEGPA